jgi:hypothetical protein
MFTDAVDDPKNLAAIVNFARLSTATLTRLSSPEALHVEPDSRDDIHAAGLGVDYELYCFSQHDPAPEIDSA